jgi:hypothetical protein
MAHNVPKYILLESGDLMRYMAPETKKEPPAQSGGDPKAPGAT